jgi:hypothetical protein
MRTKVKTFSANLKTCICKKIRIFACDMRTVVIGAFLALGALLSAQTEKKQAQPAQPTPAQQPGKPAAQPAKPSAQPASEQQPGKPAAQPGKPSVQPAKPTTAAEPAQPAKPGAQPARPTTAAEPGKPTPPPPSQPTPHKANP